MLAPPVHSAPVNSAIKAPNSVFPRGAFTFRLSANFPEGIIVGRRADGLAYWAAFLRRKGWPMGPPGTHLNHRAAFLYARIWAALAALVACSVMAQAPALIVQEAWARQVPGSDVAAVYLSLRNPTTQPVRIVGVESSLASHAMIHETQTESGQSRMRPHEQLVVPAGQTVKLEPGGLHVMLHGVMRPIAAGQSVPLTLLLADGNKIQVAAVVRPLNAQ
jgi:copper(I)-binding protein